MSHWAKGGQIATWLAADAGEFPGHEHRFPADGQSVDKGVETAGSAWIPEGDVAGRQTQGGDSLAILAVQPGELPPDVDPAPADDQRPNCATGVGVPGGEFPADGI